MADLVDEAHVIEQEHITRLVNAARRPVPRGAPGHCMECEEFSPRLIESRCAPCRDGRTRQ